jgi:ubiquinone/menaquinone biosynthesis C-methylase UbiE
MAGIYRWALKTAGLQPGESVLDIGTGRGELVALAVEQGARRAIGIEYSAAATALCRQTFAAHAVAGSAVAVRADARQLPVRDGSVDLVVMLDVVEHLTEDELSRCLVEIRRSLSPHGRLFIHTFPTSTVYNVTYRAQRNVLPWRRRRWPANPRSAAEQAMHVNEQTPGRLGRSLRRAGLRGETISLGEWVYCDFVPDEGARNTYRRLARHRMTARFGIANLWAIARPDQPAT